MKRVVALVAAAGILGLLWWILRPAARPAHVVLPPTDSKSHEPGPEDELVPQRLAPVLLPLREAEPIAQRPAADPKRRAAPAKAPVRGQLLVAETGDPIRETLSIRLRTLDLEQKEDLLTLSNGWFTSAKSYPAGVLLAQVKDGEGRELADHEAAFDPSATEPWLVPIPYDAYPTFVRGRVVDLQDSPLDDVSVRIVPLGSPLAWNDEDTLPWIEEGWSDEDGRFELSVLCGGSHRLDLQGLWKSESREILLHTGANDLGTLVLNEPRSAGLTVRFVCADDTAGPIALIVVQPATIPGELVFYSCPFAEHHAITPLSAKEHGSGNFEVQLPRLPSGACTLKIEALDGREYEPGLAVVDVPGALEVRVSGKQRQMKRLRALDGKTGQPITRFQPWTRCKGVWDTSVLTERGELLLEGADAWVVLARGYRGARGTDAPEEDGLVEVSLEPASWSALLVFEEAAGDTFGNPESARNRRSLAGVEVFADGRSVGTSDDEGMLLLSSDSRPRELAFRLEGWHVVEESDTGDGVPPSGSVHHVWMHPDG